MKKEKIILGKHALILKEYLKEENPSLYKEMKKDNSLETFLDTRETKYLEEVERLTKSGMSEDRARELMWEGLMSIPMENVKK